MSNAGHLAKPAPDHGQPREQPEAKCRLCGYLFLVEGLREGLCEVCRELAL